MNDFVKINKETIGGDPVLRDFLKEATMAPFINDVRLNTEDYEVPLGLCLYGHVEDGTLLVPDETVEGILEEILKDEAVAASIICSPHAVERLCRIPSLKDFGVRQMYGEEIVCGQSSNLECLLKLVRICATFGIRACFTHGHGSVHDREWTVEKDEVMLDIPGTRGDAVPHIEGWECIRARTTGGWGHTYIRYWKTATPERVVAEFEKYPRSDEYSVVLHDGRVVVYTTTPGVWVGERGRWVKAYSRLGVRVSVTHVQMQDRYRPIPQEMIERYKKDAVWCKNKAGALELCFVPDHPVWGEVTKYLEDLGQRRAHLLGQQEVAASLGERMRRAIVARGFKWGVRRASVGDVWNRYHSNFWDLKETYVVPRDAVPVNEDVRVRWWWDTHTVAPEWSLHVREGSCFLMNDDGEKRVLDNLSDEALNEVLDATFGTARALACDNTPKVLPPTALELFGKKVQLEYGPGSGWNTYGPRASLLFQGKDAHLWRDIPQGWGTLPCGFGSIELEVVFEIDPADKKKGYGWVYCHKDQNLKECLDQELTKRTVGEIGLSVAMGERIASIVSGRRSATVFR